MIDVMIFSYDNSWQVKGEPCCQWWKPLINACPRAIIPVWMAMDIKSISFVIVIDKQKGGQAGY